MVQNNDNIQQRDEDNKKRCRRYNKRKQRRLYVHGTELQRENKRKRSKKLKKGERDGKRKSKDKVENSVSFWENVYCQRQKHFYYIRHKAGCLFFNTFLLSYFKFSVNVIYDK
jgi:hypothetical protein